MHRQYLVLQLLFYTVLSEWTSMIMYDVLSEDCRHNVTNKDMGDPAGDAYFNLKDVYLPLACPSCKASSRGCRTPSTFDCNNPESNGNLVVRKVSVEVLQYGTYNLCNVEDTCTYKCKTFSRHPKPGVGKQAVCGGNFQECMSAPTPGWGMSNAWDYWDYNTAVLMGSAGNTNTKNTNKTITTGNGQWFSLEAKDEGTYWRNATILKTGNAECQRVALQEQVEKNGAECFAKCSGSTNTTDPCWIRCYFDTVLGQNSNTSKTPSGGMSSKDVTNAWLKGFESDDFSQGGCPRCPETGGCPRPSIMETKDVVKSRGAPRSVV